MIIRRWRNEVCVVFVDAGITMSVIERRDELDKTVEGLRQLREFGDSLRSQIEISKRAAHKGEEEIVQREKRMAGQDVLIDNLHARMQKLEEEIQRFDQQIEAQKKESDAARTAVTEATKEIDVRHIYRCFFDVIGNYVW